MYTYYSAILFKAVGPAVPIIPPDEIDLFNLAPVPMGHRFESWIDTDSPFTETEIPRGAHWAYSVHVVEPTGDPECPLKAGRMVGGLFLNIKDAEHIAAQVENKGWFVCVYAALVTDRGSLS